MNAQHIHLDPLGGIAGDMFVAALLDTFPEFKETVFADIAAVLPPEIGEIVLQEVMKNGIRARHFSLEEKTHTHGEKQAHERNHEHAHEHAYKTKKAHSHTHENLALNGNYANIKTHIGSANLSPNTAKHALAILEIIAKAEAHIHNVSLDAVHFHELAAWDSLMDVVAAGSIIAKLPNTLWTSAALPLGAGFIKTAHGILPVPAPATAKILEGFAFRTDDIKGERVTPTGAAILRYLITDENIHKKPAGNLCAQGYGAGTKNFAELPNVLRASVFKLSPESQTSQTKTQITLVQFDIDDMSGEEIAQAADNLRAVDGVLDLLLIAALGKKARPVTLFQLQIDSVKMDACCDFIFSETSTIGVRFCAMERRVLPRSAIQNHDLPIKEVIRPNGEITRKVENDALTKTRGLFARRQLKRLAEETS